MAKTIINSIGIEHDAFSIRAAKISLTHSGSKMKVQVLGLSELRGDFSNDENLSVGMKKIKEKVAIGASDRVVTCLSGKQVFVAQIPFRHLPEDEMKNALRLEIKKNLPFEVAGASIDFQTVGGVKKGDDQQIIVTAVPNVMLTRHINIMERLGVKPYIVDVLPLAIANAFHLSQQTTVQGLAYVVLQIGPSVTNLIVCGDDNVSFFHRSIYFSFDELFGEGHDAEPPSDDVLAKKLGDLADEIGRSLSFYEKSFSINNFAGVFLLGEYLENEGIKTAIGDKTELQTEILDVFSVLKQSSNAPHGKFEVAMALAMRNTM
jgi:Tfp pilus assembly PilM family ATPase